MSERLGYAVCKKCTQPFEARITTTMKGPKEQKIYGPSGLNEEGIEVETPIGDAITTGAAHQMSNGPGWYVTVKFWDGFTCRFHRDRVSIKHKV